MNCDRIARTYRWLEYIGFGRELERRRFRFIRDVSGAQKVLMLGEGDGRFLARFSQANPLASIDYVDSSARMLGLARSRCGTSRICYKSANARDLVLPGAAYDLICTHFFLECFEARDVELLTQRLANAACPGAKWLISEFRQPQRGWRAVWAWLWLRTLYLFFGIATHLGTRRLADHRPVLAKHGFRLELEETSRFGLLSSELWVLDI